jgi:hypothetical protein
MTWIMKLYPFVLKLYPRQFCTRLATEMEEVFHAGLEDAYEQGEDVGFILREILRLPGSLVGVYVWSMREGNRGKVALSSVGGGGNDRGADARRRMGCSATGWAITPADGDFHCEFGGDRFSQQYQAEHFSLYPDSLLPAVVGGVVILYI